MFLTPIFLSPHCDRAEERVLSSNSYAGKADFDRFDQVMARVLDVDPLPGDEPIQDNSVSGQYARLEEAIALSIIFGLD